MSYLHLLSLLITFSFSAFSSASETTTEAANVLEQPVETANALEQPVEPANALEQPVETANALEQPVKTANALEQPVENANALEQPVETANALEQPVETVPLEPYPEFSAGYTATWSGGWFPITVSARRSLKYSSNGTGTLTFEAISAIAGLQEISTFRTVNNMIQPLQYQYLRTGLFKEDDRNQLFDWSLKKVINGDNQSVFKGHWNDAIQDNLSYNLQASIDLSNKKTELAYPVFDRKKIKMFTFKIIGPEKLKTEVGVLKTIKIEQIERKKSKQKTYTWFAVDYDYLLVRLQQTKKDGQVYEIDITDGQINGKVLSQ